MYSKVKYFITYNYGALISDGRSIRLKTFCRDTLSTIKASQVVVLNDVT